ncbi:zinc-dependent metalloprotease [Arthrobacter sp. STN4]|uniref:zinc-dependent metalloprotease n=1 Tax=Arthrobacter sp. STN4 TaxID=2923276 RepID=UPI00211A97A1|nr:zinc-dependent metalloprotease [Arthrobacter sp. STN4]MCQ9162570.1 zinc-dependent metalloprotease [Arthrobacter sp. STN4]
MSPHSSAQSAPSAPEGSPTPAGRGTPSGSKPSSLVNWELAARTAANLAPAGPALGSREIGAAVENLRLMAERSVPHVHEISKLEAARDLRDSEVLVVDRASWAKANTQSFAVMMDPIMSLLAAKQAAAGKNTAAAGATVTGAQLGAVLAFLSSKVLGQYDPFAALGASGTAPGNAGQGATAAASGGRLLLVAPNIITVERDLKVDPDDFRLWVCLHEQTHRVQFAAAPWLRHHMLAEIEKLGGLLVGDSDKLGEKMLQAVKSLGSRSLGGKRAAPDGPSRGAVLDLLQDPAEKAALSHVTAVMSLLEGHANVVMDGVDQTIVPTVRTIRQRFNNRGRDRGMLEKFIRNLMGLDAKMRQYSDGAKFVRDVVAVAGMEGFNTVWAQAENLPTETEIHNARLWVERMGL